MATIGEAMALALQHHQAGDLARAEAIYRQILQVDPSEPGALHFLGMVAHQRGQQDLAIHYMRQSLARMPDNPIFHCNLGFAYQTMGQVEDAIFCYREAIRLGPGYIEAHVNLGNALADQGKLAEAVAAYECALKLNPQYAPAHSNLAVALEKLGKPREAEAHCRKALSVQPDFVDALVNLGNALRAQGKLDEAVLHLQQALRLKPGNVPAFNSLAAALQAQGKFEEAEANCRQAIRLQANSALAHNNLGCALQGQGKAAQAVASFAEAARLNPRYAEAHYNLGNVLADQGLFDEAVASYRQALTLKPDFSDALASLGFLLGDQQGQVDEAVACFQQALRIKPDDRFRIALATALPVIYRSEADLEAWRARLIQHVRQLVEARVVVDVTETPASILFLLAYQGLNDRDIQRDVASLYRAPASPLDMSPLPEPGARKIRIGFLSSFFRAHTIGHWTRGLVAQLSREAFHVTVLSIGGSHDEIAGFFKQHADSYVEVPKHLPSARRLIAEQRLDVLFYADIGMDPITYTLAFTRLAPVQCVTLGHPVTTGIDTIDYFFSAKDLESAESDQHYSEKLIRLETLPVYFYRPKPPPALKTKAHFGLSMSDHVYACPQSLFKFHPGFDATLGGILRGDPRGKLVLVQSQGRRWEKLLQRRFAETLADVADRIVFLPRLDFTEYMSLLAIADVLLDTPYFGGGSTSYEGFAVGTPIVTMPSKLLRGRITFAMYQQMQILDCVTDSPGGYINTALRLGTDADFREAMHKKILAANEVLYENPQGVRELEQFFLQHATPCRLDCSTGKS